MGNADTKLNFRKAVINLTTKTEPVEADDDTFWEQFWSDSVSSIQVSPGWLKMLYVGQVIHCNPNSYQSGCVRFGAKCRNTSAEGRVSIEPCNTLL